MKTQLMSFRRIVITGIYVLLIFSFLMLIRSQNKHLISRENTSLQHTLDTGTI
ncbi:MAG: hypothetical protein V4539_17415 [Bacteroidota bacterium]